MTSDEGSCSLTRRVLYCLLCCRHLHFFPCHHSTCQRTCRCCVYSSRHLSRIALTHPRPLPLSPTRRARTTSIHVQLTASTHHPSTNQPYAYRYTLALPSAFHHRHHLSLTLTPPRLSFTTARRRIYGGLAGGYAIATSLQSWVRALHSLCGAATRISLMCLLLAEAARSAGDSHPLATCSAVRSSSRRTTKMAAVS